MSDARILLVEDDTALRGALAETLALSNYSVVEADDGESALEVISREEISAVVTDYQMSPMDGYELLCRLRQSRPELPVLLMTAHGTIQHAVDSMQQGATEYLVKPFEAPTLLEKLRGVIPDLAEQDDMVAVDPSTQRIMRFAEKVAPCDTTVLLSGESGTGKEVFARYIHSQSERADGPFVGVNCAAIPENMLEATLFGHERGAFTGAHVAREGKFELAQGGTLLLDEISEIDPSLQAKLLRVLQEREVERVGGKSPIKLDVRILATSNRDLLDCVKRGLFREDLFYRLSVFPIHLPPLRSRPADILPLANHFLSLGCGTRRQVPAIASDARERLQSYPWPGNVRELQNVMDRALILADGNQVQAPDLQFEMLDAMTSPDLTVEPQVTEPNLKSNLRNVEERLVVDALNEAGGIRKRAAEILGVSSRTLRYKIARLREAGIEVD